MLANLDDRYVRAFQISIVFAIAVFVERFSQVQHGTWILTTTAIVYASFDSSLVIQRAYYRFIGTVFGITVCLAIWYIDKWNFRLTVIILTIDIALLTFFSAATYYVYVTFSTIGTDFLLAFIDPGNFFEYNFVFSRFLDTVIAFTICIICEYFLFSRFYNIKKRRLMTAQAKLVNSMDTLIRTDNISYVSYQTSFIRKVISINKQMVYLNSMLKTVEYHYGNQDDFNSHKFVEFMKVIDKIYSGIFAIYYLSSDRWNDSELKFDIEQGTIKLIETANNLKIT